MATQFKVNQFQSSDSKLFSNNLLNSNEFCADNFTELKINTANTNIFSIYPINEQFLVTKTSYINNKELNTPLNGNDGSNLISSGLIKNIEGQLNVQAWPFANCLSHKKLNVVKSSIEIGNQFYEDFTFLE